MCHLYQSKSASDTTFREIQCFYGFLFVNYAHLSYRNWCIWHIVIAALWYLPNI